MQVYIQFHVTSFNESLSVCDLEKFVFIVYRTFDFVGSYVSHVMLFR